MNGNLMVLLPLLGFMAAMLALGIYVRRQSHAGRRSARSCSR